MRRLLTACSSEALHDCRVRSRQLAAMLLCAILSGSVPTRQIASIGCHLAAGSLPSPGLSECRQLFCARCARHAAAASSWLPSAASPLPVPDIRASLSLTTTPP